MLMTAITFTILVAARHLEVILSCPVLIILYQQVAPIANVSKVRLEQLLNCIKWKYFFVIGNNIYTSVF